MFGLTSLMTNANAGDLYAPDYAPYSNAASNYERPIDRERYYGAAPPPVYGRVEVGEGTCRVFHERRVGSYGRETIHRIRMCDEGPAYSSPTAWWWLRSTSAGHGAITSGLAMIPIRARLPRP